MANNTTYLNSWSVTTAVTVCGKPAPPDEEVQGRLKRRGWELGGRTTSVSRALHEISAGKASVLILEDSRELPIAVMLRQLIRSKIGLLTPTIATYNDYSHDEKPCYGSIGHPMLIEGPTTPSSFVESFEFLLLRWSQKQLQPLKEAGMHLAKGNTQSCIKLLSEPATCDDSQVYSVAGPCLSLFFRDQDRRVSEKILLGLLEKSKKNMGILLSLVDLYLESAMPGYALKLLKTASNAFSNPRCISLDFLQTYLLLNDIQSAIKVVARMKLDGYMPSVPERYLARLAITEGDKTRFNAQTKAKGQREEYLAAWELSDTLKAS